MKFALSLNILIRIMLTFDCSNKSMLVVKGENATSRLKTKKKHNWERAPKRRMGELWRGGGAERITGS